MKEDGSICSDIFDDVHPAFPIFDKSGNGIIFHGFHLPIDKLGLIYCFNRPTKLYYLKQYENNEEVKEEKSDSSKIIFEAETLTPDYYFAAFPKFTDDYKYLSFFCSKDKFHTHATSLGLDVIENLCEACSPENPAPTRPRRGTGLFDKKNFDPPPPPLFHTYNINYFVLKNI